MPEAVPTGGRERILVLAPMPARPASAGNRRRLDATCEALERGGFSVDLACFAQEDQVYRRFGHHPPTDLAGMERAFARVFLVEPRARVSLRTKSEHFGIDDWCPDEVGDFVARYFAENPGTRAILVNYVFLSRALERVPPGVLKLIDTHDRFAGRREQYRPFRAEPNFFYTDETGEAAGLARADLVLALQSAEARHFAALTDRPVLVLPPRFPPRRGFRAPRRLARIGFVGHGNDPNLFSIRRFAEVWSEGWTPGRPELVVAGEICTALGGLALPGVRLAGYVERIESFYETVDLVVAPMLLGTGLKMKVGEALAFGVPVVGTEIGFEGFESGEPAHRCWDAAAVKARILAMAEDPAALAALTEACAALLAGYEARAAEAERALIARLRASGGGAAPPVPAEAPPEPEPVVTTDLGAVVLACERSARSLPAADPALGLLVATERRPADTSPLRQRFFARPAQAATPQEGVPGLGAVSVALAPEWVRGRALPPAARAALATAFADVVPDWTSDARPVGRAGECVEIALYLPSFLARGRHPHAAFLIGPERRPARELRLEGVTPLQVPPRSLAPDPMPGDLTPVPVCARFLGHAGDGLPEGRLLLLTDDLIGRVTLRAEGAA